MPHPETASSSLQILNEAAAIVVESDRLYDFLQGRGEPRKKLGNEVLGKALHILSRHRQEIERLIDTSKTLPANGVVQGSLKEIEDRLTILRQRETEIGGWLSNGDGLSGQE